MVVCHVAGVQVQPLQVIGREEGLQLSMAQSWGGGHDDGVEVRALGGVGTGRYIQTCTVHVLTGVHFEIYPRGGKMSIFEKEGGGGGEPCVHVQN